MKKTLALISLAAVLAAPLSAQAHRQWISPSATILSGNDAWITVDVASSNGVFNPDHVAVRLSGLEVTAPDGSTVEAQNLHQGKLRSNFDVQLQQQGTYRVANVVSGFMASYKLDGEQKRWRRAEADFPGALPEGATDISATRTNGRTETFVTLGAPTEIKPVGQGLELAPVTHPNDVVVGEPASFRLLNNGQAAAGVEVTLVRGGLRYRDNPGEIKVTTDADGAFSLTFEDAGLYWLGASVRTPGAEGQPGHNASYNGALEVLP